MKKLLLSLALLSVFVLPVSAQAPAAAAPATMPFGKIDNADLEMKACDFEKDANAEILFDKGDVYFDQQFTVIMERHTRIKIFNDNGKNEANIRIEFYGGNKSENVYGLDAETINIVNGKPEITKLDKKQVFIQNVDKVRSAMVFSFPNVKPGSVIEYKYKETCMDVPDWFFQHDIPARYTECTTSIPDMFFYKTQTRTVQPYSKNVHSADSHTLGSGENAFTYNDNIDLRAMVNVHSLPDEPFMSSGADNLQCVLFQLTSIRPTVGVVKTFVDSWPKVGGVLEEDGDFGGQLKRKLNNEEEIIAKAKALKTDDDKIAYVFNKVRDDMKWDGIDRWYTNDGTYRAWEKKTGNSTELNLVLYHLLKQSGINAYPMVVSTRDHGKVYPSYPFLYQFNRAVVYIPVDSTKHYILDATGKYNTYNETPENLLNSYGLYIDKEHNQYDMLFLKQEEPVRQMVIINAEIKSNGKMEGNAQLYNYHHSRINTIKRYKTDGEKKYNDYLRNDDNNLKISSLKFESMDVDTLPLKQNVDFTLDLTADDNYIYITPNIFTPLKRNAFLSENRFSDIDFSYRNNYSINGTYKIPAGYKADALPKSVSMTMPDKSIVFRRIVANEDGAVMIRYVIDYKKSVYFKEDYPEIRDFYKKMYEMLSEQIVLKKS